MTFMFLRHSHILQKPKNVYQGLQSLTVHTQNSPGWFVHLYDKEADSQTDSDGPVLA